MHKMVLFLAAYINAVITQTDYSVNLYESGGCLFRVQNLPFHDLIQRYTAQKNTLFHT